MNAVMVLLNVMAFIICVLIGGVVISLLMLLITEIAKAISINMTVIKHEQELRKRRIDDVAYEEM